MTSLTTLSRTKPAFVRREIFRSFESREELVVQVKLNKTKAMVLRRFHDLYVLVGTISLVNNAEAQQSCCRRLERNGCSPGDDFSLHGVCDLDEKPVF